MEQDDGILATLTDAPDHFRRVNLVIIDDHAFHVRMGLFQTCLHILNKFAPHFRATGQRDDALCTGKDMEYHVQ